MKGIRRRLTLPRTVAARGSGVVRWCSPWQRHLETERPDGAGLSVVVGEQTAQAERLHGGEVEPVEGSAVDGSPRTNLPRGQLDRLGRARCQLVGVRA